MINKIIKEEIYKYLNDRKINYEITNHQAVYNMDELDDVDLPYKKFSGVVCDARFIVRPKSKEGWFEWLSFKEKEKNDCEELRKEILL